MFEHKIAQEAEAREKTALMDSQAQEFLQAWYAMKNEGKDPARLRRLEVKVDILWQKLSQGAQDAIWIVIFPEQKEIKDVFQAHIVRLR